MIVNNFCKLGSIGALITLPFWYSPTLAGHGYSVCYQTAKLAHKACLFDLKDDMLITKANCINMSNQEAKRNCMANLRQEVNEANKLCDQQYWARNDLCFLLDEHKYDPSDFWQAENFVDPTKIGSSVAINPYFPLAPGVKTLENEDETITVTVTNKTKIINGVTCVVVNDLVTADGNAVEDTDDWYAQDIHGNVWYCGEVSLNYELFEGDMPLDAELVHIEGSWKAFKDGAKPGVLMKAWPQVGDAYRQEVALGDAEDAAEVISINEDGLLPGDNCAEDREEIIELIESLCNSDCLVTHEFTPVDPDASEHKYYAANIGLILEVNPEGECTVIDMNNVK